MHPLYGRGYFPLYWAAYYGHIDCVKLLLEKGACVYAANGGGGGALSETFLGTVLKKGHSKIAELLIQNGTPVNNPSSNDLPSPLHWAAYHGYIDIVRLLLAKGANINAYTRRYISKSGTVLRWALEQGHVEIADLLIRRGACLSEDRYLYRAASHGDTAVVRFLLAKGANINEKEGDERGATALLVALEKGHEQTAKLLVQHKGVDVNAKDYFGSNYSPLHWAASHGYTDIVRLLLAKGASIQARGRDGKTALMLAVAQGHAEIIKLLSEHGA